MTIEEQRARWGAAIREARKKKGLSQEQLAGLWGNTLSYLQKIETGIKGNEESYTELMALLREQRKRA